MFHHIPLDQSGMRHWFLSVVDVLVGVIIEENHRALGRKFLDGFDALHAIPFKSIRFPYPLFFTSNLQAFINSLMSNFKS